MSAIIIPRKHYTQPQGRVTIAPEWVNYGMVWGWTPDSSVMTQVSNPVVVATPYGKAVQGNGSSSFVWMPWDNPSVTLDEFTLAALTYTENTGQIDKRILSLGLSTSDNPLFNLETSSVSSYLRLQVRSITNQIQNLNDEYNAANPWRNQSPNGVLAIGRRSVTRNMMRVGSSDDLPDGQTTAPALSATTFNRISINALIRNSAAGWYQGETGFAAVFDQYIDDEMCKAIRQNPWQTLRADPIRIYSLPSGPIIPSISAVTMSDILQTSATTNIQLVF